MLAEMPCQARYVPAALSQLLEELSVGVAKAPLNRRQSLLWVWSARRNVLGCGRRRKWSVTLSGQFEEALVTLTPLPDETHGSMAEGRAEVGVPIVNSGRAPALPDNKRYGELRFQVFPVHFGKAGCCPPDSFPILLPFTGFPSSALGRRGFVRAA